jgi:hypothetical protein
LEESMKDALLQSGERLAEAMRAGLLAQGLSSALCLIVEEGRVRVVSNSAVVRQAELGCAGVQPRGVMEGAARGAAAHVVRALAQDLEAFVK